MSAKLPLYPPGIISLVVDSIASTSLNISWSLADGAAVTGYSISYSNTDTQCFTDSDTVSGITAGETGHTLTDLEEATEYTITVTALLTGGGSGEDSITATTRAAGEVACSHDSLSNYSFHDFSLILYSIQLHLPLPPLSVHLM